MVVIGEQRHVEESLLQRNLSSIRQGLGREISGSGAFLFLTNLLVDLFIFTSGCGFAWTSPVLSKLRSNDTRINPLGIPITRVEESLIAGLPFIGCLFGPLLISLFLDKFGRKKLMGTSGVFQIVHFAILGFAKSVWLYYVARFLLGLCFSVLGPVLTIYISEISSKSNRGRYVSMFGMFIPLGSLYSFILGPWFSVENFSIWCAVPSFVGSIFFVCFVPDSPTYFVSKRKYSEAAHALQKFRGQQLIYAELKEIMEMVKEDTDSNRRSFISIFKNRKILKGLKVALGVSLIQILSGMNVVITFLAPIIDSINSVSISGDFVAIIIGLVKVCSFTFTAAVIEKIGRRPLLIISAFTTSLCLLIFGLYFQFKNISYIQELSWIPIVCLLLYTVCFAIGVGPIPMIYIGEIFPNDLKSKAVSVVVFVITLVGFFTTFSFRFVVDYLGMSVAFWIFGGFTLLGAIFVYFQAPETKGKSLLEIQQMLGESKQPKV